MKVYKRYIATIVKQPKKIYDVYSHRNMLFFLMSFTDRDGKRQFFNVVAVNDKHGDYLDFFYKYANVGDIWDITGYITKIKALGYKKKITAIRIRKFKPKWVNYYVFKLAKMYIDAHERIENGSVKEIKEIVNNNVTTDNAKNFYIDSLKFMRKSKKHKEKRLITEMVLYKGLANKYYEDGDKYRAWALMILNKYIISKYISKKYINNNSESIERLITLKDTTTPVHLIP